MDQRQALAELQLIRTVLQATRRRVDPQMFHLIIWGALVLVWYPLMTWLELGGRGREQLWVSVVAVGSGMLLSLVLGYRFSRYPRLPAANTGLANQLAVSVATFVGAGMVLSFSIPALAPGGERYIPHVWGALYAFLLIITGIFYSSEFVVFGVLVFGGTLAALAWPTHAGFILGPTMGLGCIVPGIIAERRVARLRAEQLGTALAGGSNEEL